MQTTNKTVDALGIGNPILDFGRNDVHFASNFKNGRAFTIQITNSATANGGDNGVRKLVLFAGLDQAIGAGAVAGLLKDGAFTDINAASGLTGISQEAKSILALQKYLMARPTVLKAMHLQFSDPLQAGASFRVSYDDPFQVKPDRNLRASTSYDQNTNNTSYLLIDKIDEILDGDTALYYQLNPGITVTITFYFGGSTSLKKLLTTLKATAEAEIATVGQATIDRMDVIAASQSR
ncbi:hypothetical protein [Fibrella forsythiae]|uniref:Viral coat protein P2 N-terminal domain-containing protein n=1 Tax=Fibrella forsythiae TaxID=2817061 RepID=A0ABS3JAH7_9BACT|nr:hypothetical protein [Fibrella forsythiae]MBO0946992.1 hypothetical protein [Fibrella forsythiae]